MKHTYEIEFEVGQRVSWNYFGMPEGAADQRGLGRVSRVCIHQYRDSYYVRYDIESSDRTRIIEDIPASCVFAQPAESMAL